MGGIFHKYPLFREVVLFFAKFRPRCGVLFIILCIFTSFLPRKSPQIPYFSAALRAGFYFSQIIRDSRGGFISNKKIR